MTSECLSSDILFWLIGHDVIGIGMLWSTKIGSLLKKKFAIKWTFFFGEWTKNFGYVIAYGCHRLSETNLKDVAMTIKIISCWMWFQEESPL